MSDSIQLSPISPVMPRPAVKRVAPKVEAPTPPGPPTEARPDGHQTADAPPPVDPAAPARPETRLTITRDDAANMFVYRSVDKKTGEVVWQYPVEQVLRLAHRLRELEGLDAHRIDERI